jgi:hypothetical protein
VTAPPVDRRSPDDIVAWAEALASCSRVFPGPDLLGKRLGRDVAHPDEPLKVVARAGEIVGAGLLGTIQELPWQRLGELLMKARLSQDVVHPGTRRPYPAGLIVDSTGLAQELEDLARVWGPRVLLGIQLPWPISDMHVTYAAGTPIDDDMALLVERRAWVHVQGWQPRSDGRLDAGGALIRVFGRFAGIVVDRLNRSLGKHELAFLDLVGVPPSPPLAARAPLTFRLAQGSPVEAVVPAGTQVVAAPLEGEKDPVVFETEHPLVVTRSSLAAAFVADPEADLSSDRSAEALGQEDGAWEPFEGDRVVTRDLYVACDARLAQPLVKDVVVESLAGSDGRDLLRLPKTWSGWDGTAWTPLAATETLGPAPPGDDGWQVVLHGLPPLQPTTVDGREAAWLRAQLTGPLLGPRTGVPATVAVHRSPVERFRLPLAPFGDTTPTRWFYVNVDAVVGEVPAGVEIDLELERPGASPDVRLDWDYHEGDTWFPIGRSVAGSTGSARGAVAFRDDTLALTTNGAVAFTLEGAWPQSLFNRHVGRWLRIGVESGAYAVLPVLRALTVRQVQPIPRVGPVTVHCVTAATAPAPPTLVPPAAAYNATVLDVTKELAPFGEQPRPFDTFYLALPDEVALPAASVAVETKMVNPPTSDGVAGFPPVSTSHPRKVTWEAWDGETWREALGPGLTTDNAVVVMRAGGTVDLQLPPTIGTTAVCGIEGRWVRARITSGDFGKLPSYKPAVGGAGYTLDPGDVRPPLLSSVGVRLADLPLSTPVPPTAVLSFDGFAFADHTAAAVGGGGFRPFTPLPDDAPALYLGFDQPFGNRPVSLYLQVDTPSPDEVAGDRLADLDPATRADLTWEYSAAGGTWQHLGAEDGTRGLQVPGVVRFLGPADGEARARFGRTLHWLRLRWRDGSFPVTPRLRRAVLNTGWAAQVVTVEGEILGSGSGLAGLGFTTAQAPLQPGWQLVVREPEPPAGAGLVALVRDEGPDAVRTSVDAAGHPDEIWVRWHAVADFAASGPLDRHYTLDPLTGAVRFGDGHRGSIPPRGVNNVRITYRSGGGASGNRPAASLVHLRSGVPYVDGVTSVEPAEGGADRESLDRLRVRVPATLRHRDRAVTAQDVEDLAYEASAEVARAFAVTPDFEPYDLHLDPGETLSPDRVGTEAGRYGVVVVPRGDDARPVPSLGLIAAVRDHLRARAVLTADLWVAGPEWVQVTATVTVVPTSLDVADAVVAQVRAALDGFLHPLAGGRTHAGWAPGRVPHRSDLFAVVEGVAGVDHVRTLTVRYEPEVDDPIFAEQLQAVLPRAHAAAVGEDVDEDGAGPGGDGDGDDEETARRRELRRWTERALVHPGPHRITVVPEPAGE